MKNISQKKKNTCLHLSLNIVSRDKNLIKMTLFAELMNCIAKVASAVNAKCIYPRSKARPK